MTDLCTPPNVPDVFLSSQFPGRTSPSSTFRKDQMFDYQCALLDHGLLYMNFRDVVVEGDGERILRC